MKELIAVFICSGLGGKLGFDLVDRLKVCTNDIFRLGLLLLIWLLVLGFVIGLAYHKKILSSIARLFLTDGFCGGFSRSYMSTNSARLQP